MKSHDDNGSAVGTPYAEEAPSCCDAMWGGALSVWQPARGYGYRFNLDPILLAGQVGFSERVLDLGAGCGIVSLLLVGSGRCAKATAVERQTGMAELCRRNAVDNRMTEQLEIVCCDLRHFKAGNPYDAVVFNPPYFPHGAGRASPHPGRDAARHERYGTLADFVACAARSLRPQGSAHAIVRWQRADELVDLCVAQGLSRINVRPVLPRNDASPQHVLVAARRPSATKTTDGPPNGVHQVTPLVVHGPVGRTYSHEVQGLLDGPASVPAARGW